MRYLAVILLIATAVGCASIQPPPGGEEDKTPPQIEESYPAQGALNVSRTPHIRFSFKHNIDRNSLMQAVTMTPYMSGQVKFDWSGYDEVELELPDTLRRNTTYIVTLSKDLKTQRAGTLTEPYQLIFSTGSEIDTGIISGQILSPLSEGAPANLKNVSVFAYDISVVNPDTLHLDSVRPDFITQPADNGNFSIKALKVGHKYRFIALTDEFRNKVYDKGIDAFGMPAGDVLLSTPALGGVTIRMMPKVDTAKPELQDYEIIDAHHVRARFSKPLDSSSIRASAFLLQDSSSGNQIPVLAAYRENIDKKGGVVTIVTETLGHNKTYRLAVLPSIVKDITGGNLDSIHSSLSIITNDVRDTFPQPKFPGFPILDSMAGIDPQFKAVLNFSDAIDTASFKNGLVFIDSFKKPVPYTLTWLDGIRAKLQATLLPKAFYKLSIPVSAIKSVLPNQPGPIKDTILHAGFFTGEITEFGTVSGEVSISDSILQSGHIVIRLLTDDGKVQSQLQLEKGIRTYLFAKIPKGKYRVQAWLTNRADGAYEGGSPIPLHFALPSGDYSDFIDVRPKWTVEHVDITLR